MYVAPSRNLNFAAILGGYYQSYLENKECNERYRHYSNSKYCIPSLMLWDALLVEQSVATPDELRPALP